MLNYDLDLELKQSKSDRTYEEAIAEIKNSK